MLSNLDSNLEAANVWSLLEPIFQGHHPHRGLPCPDLWTFIWLEKHFGSTAGVKARAFLLTVNKSSFMSHFKRCLVKCSSPWLNVAWLLKHGNINPNILEPCQDAAKCFTMPWISGGSRGPLSHTHHCWSQLTADFTRSDTRTAGSGSNWSWIAAVLYGWSLVWPGFERSCPQLFDTLS